MRWVPFTVHIKLTQRLGKRFEKVRDLQKIAGYIYDGLQNVANTRFAQPGGGQHRSYSGIDYGALGGSIPGCSVKPQFGNFPAQVMITGFYHANADNLQPHPEKTVISHNTTYTGPGSHLYESGPVATVHSELATLKAAMEVEITAALPASIDYTIYRIDYNNIVYGNRGIHFA